MDDPFADLPVMPDVHSRFEEISQEMRSRPPRFIFDSLSPTHSHLLDISLMECLPPEARPFHVVPKLPSTPSALPLGHHLVYFPPQSTTSQLCKDGTEKGLSPGLPFKRCVWAGGSVVFNKGWQDAFRLDGRRAVCVETIGDVSARSWPRTSPKGKPRLALKISPFGSKDDEYLASIGSINVEVVRRYGIVDQSSGEVDPDHEACKRTTQSPLIYERRKLVFFRSIPTIFKPDHFPITTTRPRLRMPADIVMTMTVPRSVLFQFSALTYNAHRIHYDVQSALKDGHTNPLVHGPLTMLLLLKALRTLLARDGDKGEVVDQIDYRNVAPIPMNEHIRVTVRQSLGGLLDLGRDTTGMRYRKWVLAIEIFEGVVAVRGTAVTLTPKS